MCPAAERAERERDGNIRIFERVDAKNPSLSSDELAVKTFVRTAVSNSGSELSWALTIPQTLLNPPTCNVTRKAHCCCMAPAIRAAVRLILQASEDKRQPSCVVHDDVSRYEAFTSIHIRP